MHLLFLLKERGTYMKDNLLNSKFELVTVGDKLVLSKVGARGVTCTIEYLALALLEQGKLEKFYQNVHFLGSVTGIDTLVEFGIKLKNKIRAVAKDNYDEIVLNTIKLMVDIRDDERSKDYNVISRKLKVVQKQIDKITEVEMLKIQEEDGTSSLTFINQI